MSKEIRDAPFFSEGHPRESLDVMARTLGHTSEFDRFTFETQYSHLTGEQIRWINERLNTAPMGLSAQAVFQRALTELSQAA